MSKSLSVVVFGYYLTSQVMCVMWTKAMTRSYYGYVGLKFVHFYWGGGGVLCYIYIETDWCIWSLGRHILTINVNYCVIFVNIFIRAFSVVDKRSFRQSDRQTDGQTCWQAESNRAPYLAINMIFFWSENHTNNTIRMLVNTLLSTPDEASLDCIKHDASLRIWAATYPWWEDLWLYQTIYIYDILATQHELELEHI